MLEYNLMVKQSYSTILVGDLETTIKDLEERYPNAGYRIT